ncbi:DUF3592 domain-containing protein [Corynebacterium pygosceleis]|uniref:DUF3592 domain-containing protein n=1 Tax=Corynebacterium pygosceleis TaxID=2800406 RepID=UPI0019052691|nr:DUF3592 domain-containing protein [Corynebacterium pygosceleis]MCL0120881.1 DUF3592 domain-containing protein [Corynebacterium pygosceleis]
MASGLLDAAVLLGTGLSGIVVAAGLVFRRVRVRRSWYRTEGTVIDAIPRPGAPADDPFRCAVITFTGPDGGLHQWIDPHHTSFAREQVGQRVDLFITRHGSGDVRRPPTVDPFFFVVMFLAVGGLALIMAGVVLGTEATLR